MKTAFYTMLALVFILFSAGDLYGQINPKKLLEKKINQALEKKAEKPKEQKQEKAEPDTDAEETKTDATGEPTLMMYSKFDFVPGEKVIFYDDFSQDNIGDFPALWNTNGSAEVVTTNLYPGRWMKFSGDGAIWTDLLLDLPENYTIEFDVIPIKGDSKNMEGYLFRLIKSINANSFDGGAVPGTAGFTYSSSYLGRPGYRSYINDSGEEELDLHGYKDDAALYQKENKLYHISIWVQKGRVRLYQDQNKLFDVPRAFTALGRKMDRIRFEEGAAMVSNIRIAVGAPDTRHKLLTEGKMVSYGIYFDVNKDVVKPQSYTSLKEIATVLTENPGVKLLIVGHTDADGTDAANLDLSKRRAASIKKELVQTFKIEASRLETDGKGESEPIAPNDSSINKALNRRVEFIRIEG